MSEAKKEVSPEQFAELMAQVKAMGQQLAAVSRRNEELEAAATGGILPEEDQPAYEVINSPQGFFSPDCVFYPEGARFVDLTGSLIPNETFLPLNRAAEQRLLDWEQSLPSQTRTPPIDLILEAAMQLRDHTGDRQSFFTDIMKKSLDLASAAGARVQVSNPITRGVKQTDVPLMTNSRFNGQDRARSATMTRYRGEGAGPADKAEPAMTGGKNELLGRFAPPRVRAG